MTAMPPTRTAPTWLALACEPAIDSDQEAAGKLRLGESACLLDDEVAQVLGCFVLAKSQCGFVPVEDDAVSMASARKPPAGAHDVSGLALQLEAPATCVVRGHCASLCSSAHFAEHRTSENRRRCGRNYRTSPLERRYSCRHR